MTEETSQPGYVRAVVHQDDDLTKIEWSHDSAWRFLPVIRNEQFGYQLESVASTTILSPANWSILLWTLKSCGTTGGRVGFDHALSKTDP